MKLFERIVIATDGSDNGQSAVREGLKIAGICRSKVFVVQVIDTRTLSSLPPEISMEGALGRMEQEASAIVDRVKQSGAGLDLETVVLNGDPGNEIIGFSRDHNADLIIVGTKGKKGIERFFLGSVAETVIRNAQSPVLVVK